MSNEVANSKFKQIYCDIPTGFGKISQRYITFIGQDEIISTPIEKTEKIVDNISRVENKIIEHYLPDYRQLTIYSKEANSLIGKVVFDDCNRRYKLEHIISENPEMTIYKSYDDFLIYIYKAPERQRDIYNKAIEYMMNYVSVRRVVLPIAILDEPYIGYVASKLNGYLTLEKYLMRYLVEEKGFEQYFNETGGLFKRYKIASHMANFLEEIHRAGYYLGEIMPTEILVSPEKDSIVFMNANRLMRLPRHKYSEVEKVFIAPELQDGCRGFDSITDTYALSKVVRFMLFPTLKEEVPNNIANRFGYEKVTSILLCKEKNEERYERPSLSYIRDACLVTSKKLHQCHKCNSWFIAHLDSMEKCSWCNSEVSHLAGARFFEYIVSGDIIPEKKENQSYSNVIGEMIFKHGKQTIDYRQMTNDAVGTIKKLPIVGIHYYPDGSITLVNLSDDRLLHTYTVEGENKKEWIEPKQDDEVDLYRGKSRIFFRISDLSKHGFKKTMVYQFFTIH